MTRNPTPEERATVGYMEHTIAHRDIAKWWASGRVLAVYTPDAAPVDRVRAG